MALLLFCVAVNKCAEEIIALQTLSRNSDLLLPLIYKNLARKGIQFKIPSDATSQLSLERAMVHMQLCIPRLRQKQMVLLLSLPSSVDFFCRCKGTKKACKEQRIFEI